MVYNVAMSYTTQTLIQSYLKRDLTSAEARLTTILIPAIQNWIDRVTGRKWEPVTESRVYDGGEEYLFVDPIIDIHQIDFLNPDGTVQSTYSSTTPDYLAYPLNNKTKTQIKLLTHKRWPTGSGRIKITGKWGERDGVPADIQYAATVLACDWLSSEDKLKSESIEGYSRTFQDTQDSNPEIKKVLESRRRILI